MKHQLPIVLAVLALVSGVAAATSARGRVYIATTLYIFCGVLVFCAITIAWYEGLPKPHITVTNFGLLPGHQNLGILIRNDGDPAYNVHPPEPVALGQGTVIFDDPLITCLRKEDGESRFVIKVRTNLGEAANSLHHDMPRWNISEFLFHFDYGDGKRPSAARYRSIGKVRFVQGRVIAEFVGQKFLWSRVLD